MRVCDKQQQSSEQKTEEDSEGCELAGRQRAVCNKYLSYESEQTCSELVVSWSRKNSKWTDQPFMDMQETTGEPWVPSGWQTTNERQVLTTSHSSPDWYEMYIRPEIIGLTLSSM